MQEKRREEIIAKYVDNPFLQSMAIEFYDNFLVIFELFVAHIEDCIKKNSDKRNLTRVQLSKPKNT